MITTDPFTRTIDETLSMLPTEARRCLDSWVLPLFHAALPHYRLGLEENPIEHHLAVWQTACLVGVASGLSTDPLIQAAAIGLLHDLAATRKITREMVERARAERGEAGAAELETLRREYRQQHMAEGARKARVLLNDLNCGLGREVFSKIAMDAVCGVIAVHDNPSNGVPIPRHLPLAVLHRECDRMWMVTDIGIMADLRRKGQDPNDSALRMKQVEWNLGAFRKERALYDPSQESFCDDETFFRVPAAQKIFLGWRRYWGV